MIRFMLANQLAKQMSDKISLSQEELYRILILRKLMF